jgi:hypothetical protein
MAPPRVSGQWSVSPGDRYHDRRAFRAVYTVRFAKAVYVLHAFEKKSKRGAKTPRADTELVRVRLKQAERQYETDYGKGIDDEQSCKGDRQQRQRV